MKLFSLQNSILKLLYCIFIYVIMLIERRNSMKLSQDLLELLDNHSHYVIHTVGMANFFLELHNLLKGSHHV
jgi:hypothetical protein